MGTMGYMSPEQLKGQHVDHRSDIFSFGAILYEMLSGKRAFRGDSMAETMSAILREDPPDLSDRKKTVSPAHAYFLSNVAWDITEQRGLIDHEMRMLGSQWRAVKNVFGAGVSPSLSPRSIRHGVRTHIR